MEFDLIVGSLLSGAIGGTLYGIAGYYKANAKSGIEVDFKWKSFVSTVLGSALIGAASVYLGMPYDAVAVSATGVLLTQFVKKLVSILEARVKKLV